MYPHLETIYRDIHSHPELGFEEVRTAALLAAEMRTLGFQVTEKVGKTGVVAIYRNGAGPTVMVRTELDALPMEEKSGLPYASKAKALFNGRDTYVAHSCGHDIHMASWIGSARALVAMKDKWQGTLMFVAQPAEELVSGAKSMLADGLFTRFPKPDFAFALHTSPAPYGTIAYNVGAVTSNSDGLEITFKGRGGHGSAPDKTIDPIAIAAHFITDVQTVISREKDPMQFGVVTIGAVQAGTVGNIIPDAATLRGTIRSYDPAVRDKLLSRRTPYGKRSCDDGWCPTARCGSRRRRSCGG
jgi:hippurate hydrolase